MEYINQLQNFLNGACRMYHAVAQLEAMLKKDGYTCLSEGADWSLVPGGKYYLTRGGSSVMAFRIPEGTPAGFMMSASHSDRPCFKVKENPELVGSYTRLATEGYGGMIMSSWADRPLSVAGRVMVETEDGVESRLVNIDRDLLLIPNVAIHMNRKVNEGMAWNLAVDTVPLLGGKDAAGKLHEEIEKLAGGQVLGKDLYLYVRQPSSLWGAEGEFISSAALDDLECAWCCTRGFMDAKESASIPVLCVFDSEEVGSCSVQGAASGMLESVLGRICQSLRLDLQKMCSQSFMVSADNAHAVHPNHPEYADVANAPVMNQGVVLKFNARLSYATDGAAAAVFRKVCALADVPVQTYHNRADLPGGGTLGRISLEHISVPTADIGLAQLAMHSAYETAGVKDVESLVKAMRIYYGCALESPADGMYRILTK